MVDPAITRNDRLVGNVLGYPDKLPEIYIEIEIDYRLLRKIIMKGTESTNPKKIEKITKGETLKFNVGSTETIGRVLELINEVKKNDLHYLN